ncbi:hypothetical protein CYMTET_27823 [Cymbomonas tetramitiformis]|uniref:Ig-like domain-containing protein n=1 Tax=Cymbomonas tetramitiformis TaxID=36881 RepID=A0AAE0FP09_9CHLO|nr:hypothetical protein CYMTET_27823 [Cymbomonas tetramitiformis]
MSCDSDESCHDTGSARKSQTPSTPPNQILAGERLADVKSIDEATNSNSGEDVLGGPLSGAGTRAIIQRILFEETEDMIKQLPKLCNTLSERVQRGYEAEECFVEMVSKLIENPTSQVMRAFAESGALLQTLKFLSTRKQAEASIMRVVEALILPALLLLLEEESESEQLICPRRATPATDPNNIAQISAGSPRKTVLEIIKAFQFLLSMKEKTAVAKFLLQNSAATIIVSIMNTAGSRLRNAAWLERENGGSPRKEGSADPEEALYSSCLAVIEKISHTGVSARRVIAGTPGIVPALTEALQAPGGGELRGARASLPTQESVEHRRTPFEEATPELCKGEDQARALGMLAEMGAMWSHHLMASAQSKLVRPTIQALLSGLVTVLEDIHQRNMGRQRNMGHQPIADAATVVAKAVIVISSAMEGHLLDCPYLHEYVRLALRRMSDFLDEPPALSDPVLCGRHQVLEAMKSIQSGYGRPIVLSPSHQVFRPRQLGEDAALALTVEPLSEVISSHSAYLYLSPCCLRKSTFFQPGKIATTGGSAHSRNIDVARAAASALQIRWMKDGRELPGCTESALHLKKVDSEHIGDYSCVLSNETGETVVQMCLALPLRLCSGCAEILEPSDQIQIAHRNLLSFCGEKSRTGACLGTLVAPNWLDFNRSGMSFVSMPSTASLGMGDEVSCFFRLHGTGHQICGVAIPSLADTEEALGQSEGSWGLLRTGDILLNGEWMAAVDSVPSRQKIPAIPSGASVGVHVRRPTDEGTHKLLTFSIDGRRVNETAPIVLHADVEFAAGAIQRGQVEVEYSQSSSAECKVLCKGCAAKWADDVIQGRMQWYETLLPASTSSGSSAPAEGSQIYNARAMQLGEAAVHEIEQQQLKWLLRQLHEFDAQLEIELEWPPHSPMGSRALRATLRNLVTTVHDEKSSICYRDGASDCLVGALHGLAGLLRNSELTTALKRGLSRHDSDGPLDQATAEKLIGCCLQLVRSMEMNVVAPAASLLGSLLGAVADVTAREFLAAHLHRLCICLQDKASARREASPGARAPHGAVLTLTPGYVHVDTRKESGGGPTLQLTSDEVALSQLVAFASSPTVNTSNEREPTDDPPPPPSSIQRSNVPPASSQIILQWWVNGELAVSENHSNAWIGNAPFNFPSTNAVGELMPSTASDSFTNSESCSAAWARNNFKQREIGWAPL